LGANGNKGRDMAEWCNARLTVVGQQSEVSRFTRHAREKPPEPLTWVPDILVTDDGEVMLLPRPQGKADAIFIPDMWVGEGGELFTARMKDLGQGLRMKRYGFQIRNDDGRSHFRSVSVRYPALQFVLVNHWGPPDECTSFLIHGGRTKPYRMPDNLMDSVLAKHGYDPDLDCDDDDEHEENYWKEREASWEMMDLAEVHWLNGVMRRIRSVPQSRLRL